MATRFQFDANNAEPPSTNAAAFVTIHSTEQRMMLAFDATTDEAAAWKAVCPAGWTGTITADIFGVMASATSGAVGFQVSVEAITPTDAVTIASATSYDTVNNSASTTVPGTLIPFKVTITLTNNDSSAPGDMIRFKLNRDADGSAITDSAAGDFYLDKLVISDGA